MIHIKMSIPLKEIGPELKKLESNVELLRKSIRSLKWDYIVYPLAILTALTLGVAFCYQPKEQDAPKQNYNLTYYSSIEERVDNYHLNP